MNIVCTGSVAYDYLMKFPGLFREQIMLDRLEHISLSFLVDEMVKQRGGTAPNIAYTLALLGERPYLLATVGEDFDEYRVWLEANGVDTSLTKVIPGKNTASFFANTDLSNAQISSFYTGAMADAKDLSVLNLPTGRPDLVVISANDPQAMQRYVNECQAEGIPYLYDPSQQLARIDPQQMIAGVQRATALFLNDYEYELLQKHTGMKEEDVLCCAGFMVITHGEDGAYIYANGERVHVPIVTPQKIADPTGVGDAFRGGFLTGYRLGLDWLSCGQMGALAATYCLEVASPQGQRYTKEEFVARYRQHFDDQGALDVLFA